MLTTQETDTATSHDVKGFGITGQSYKTYDNLYDSNWNLIAQTLSSKGAATIATNAGTTTINSGSGDDYIWTGNGNSVVSSTSGNDTIVAGSGQNQLFGGSGNDLFVAGAGSTLFNGGSGFDTVDFSKVDGNLRIDLGDHVATITDASGKVTATDHVTGVEKVIGTAAGMTIDAGKNAGVVVVGGAGNDLFHIEGTNGIFTGGGGTNGFEWTRKFVAAQAVTGAASDITDFHVGQDTLNLGDFLKGQHLAHNSHPQFSDVVHLTDNAQGTLVSVLANGQFHALVELDGLHNATLSLLVSDHALTLL